MSIPNGDAPYNATNNYEFSLDYDLMCTTFFKEGEYYVRYKNGTVLSYWQDDYAKTKTQFNLEEGVLLYNQTDIYNFNVVENIEDDSIVAFY